MPFISSAQRRKCYYLEKDDIDHNRPISWSCKKFARVYISGRWRNVYKTKRGAKYVNINGTRRYVYGVY